MKYRAAYLLAALALPCAAIGQDNPPNPNATLVYFDVANNATLDPLEPQSNSSVAQGPLMAVYDSLIRLTDEGVPQPGLAESFSYNEDLTEFTIVARRGATFHDGTKVNAAAIAHNLNRAMALGGRAGAATVETMGQIAGIEVRDESTVVLKLKNPNGQMPYLLGGQPGMMLSPAGIPDGAFGATVKPIGAGPYRVRTFEATVRTFYERFDQYWDGIAGRPALAEHHFVPDARARVNAIRSGQATMALLDSRQIPEAKAAGLTVHVNEKNVISDLYLNVGRDNIGNLKMRQAFMHALDRAALAEAVGGGVAQPTSQLFAKISPLYKPELDQIYPYDPARAKKLLTEAGYPNGVDVTWLLLNASEYKLIGEAVQAMVAEVGIRIKFEIVDISQYQQFRRPPTKGDIMLGRWGGRADPLQTFQEVAGTGGSVNGSIAATPEIDALIDKARRLNPADPKRMEPLEQLARITTEKISHIALMTRPNVYAYRPGCILNLTPYLPAGADRFNNVRVGSKCK